MDSHQNISSTRFCDIVIKSGFDFFVGVPCSLLKGVIEVLEQHPDITYIPAVREDSAVGVAVGAYLAGRRPMVLMQNSGLGVCVNALTSLAILYEIPLLLLISWRGFNGMDAPEHRIMGDAMIPILDAINIPSQLLEPENVELVVTSLAATLEEINSPTALLLRKGVLR